MNTKIKIVLLTVLSVLFCSNLFSQSKIQDLKNRHGVVVQQKGTALFGAGKTPTASPSISSMRLYRISISDLTNGIAVSGYRIGLTIRASDRNVAVGTMRLFVDNDEIALLKRAFEMESPENAHSHHRVNLRSGEIIEFGRGGGASISGIISRTGGGIVEQTVILAREDIGVIISSMNE